MVKLELPKLQTYLLQISTPDIGIKISEGRSGSVFGLALIFLTTKRRLIYYPESRATSG
jgi:hypothetical protein